MDYPQAACPYCAYEPDVLMEDRVELYWVECVPCGAMITSVGARVLYDSERDAIQAWDSYADRLARSLRG